jgi:hypothetical protein
MYQSRYKQDHFLDNYIFKGLKNGVFLDIGAYDGISFNNTYFFEKERGWKGICLEPLPARFQELQNNRQCVCINGCLASSNEPSPFYEIEGPSERASGLQAHYTKEHLKHIKADIEKYGGSINVINVTCFRPSDILNIHPFKTIHYCSLGPEGNGLDVIKSFDFDRVFVHVFSIKNHSGNRGARKFLLSKGYKKIWSLGCDDIYVHRKSAFASSKFYIALKKFF